MAFFVSLEKLTHVSDSFYKNRGLRFREVICTEITEVAYISDIILLGVSYVLLCICLKLRNQREQAASAQLIVQENLSEEFVSHHLGVRE